jgi:hypothetical protein
MFWVMLVMVAVIKLVAVLVQVRKGAVLGGSVIVAMGMQIIAMLCIGSIIVFVLVTMGKLVVAIMRMAVIMVMIFMTRHLAALPCCFVRLALLEH